VVCHDRARRTSRWVASRASRPPRIAAPTREARRDEAAASLASTCMCGSKMFEEEGDVMDRYIRGRGLDDDEGGSVPFILMENIADSAPSFGMRDAIIFFACRCVGTVRMLKVAPLGVRRHAPTILRTRPRSRARARRARTRPPSVRAAPEPPCPQGRRCGQQCPEPSRARRGEGRCSRSALQLLWVRGRRDGGAVGAARVRDGAAR
jgi:hypothetical protein